MKKSRLLTVLLIFIFAMGLLTVSIAFAQGGDSDAEAARAEAAEAEGVVEYDFRTNPDLGRGGVYPLFAGVADTAIPSYLIDPATNLSVTAFLGGDIWSAAYDPGNDRILFTSGSTLHEWPIGGAVNTLGVIQNPTGSTLSVVGLAFYNGTLYGYTASQTEGIYSIDPATQVGTLQIATVGADTDCGGLAADPNSGTFYCTSDDTSGPNGAGLYIVNNDGSLTFVTAYPPGETDVDGLTVGTDGRAYLVTDDDTPQEIYVYDLAGGVYLPSLVSPWPAGDQTFSAGAWIEQVVDQPGIVLTKTVGTDVNSCATTDTIAVPQFTTVTYCYEVMNSGTITLDYHDLVDSELGTILNGFFYSLAPGASVFVTDTDFIFNDTVNTATWTACNVGLTNASGFDCTSTSAVDVISATDVATVTIIPPSISLSKTVGTDPNVCAATSNISVDVGTDVTYCYDVTNTGPTTLTVHELSDSELGTILTGFPFTLTPGASVFVTQTANIVTDTTNVATWTACNIDGPPTLTCFDGAAFDVVSDTATANVTVLPPVPTNPSISLSKTVGLDNTVCAGSSNITVDDTVTEAYYCYTVMNTGDVTFTTHDLDDDVLGSILSGFPFVLPPGASTSVFPVTGTLSGTVTNVATWTAYVDTATFVTATATATVNVTDGPTDVSLNSFGGGSNGLALPVMVGLLTMMVAAVFFVVRRFQNISPIE